MNIETAEAKNRFIVLLRIIEGGEQVVITRHGRPISQISVTPAGPRKAHFDDMWNRIRLLPGWDGPITEEELLGEKD